MTRGSTGQALRIGVLGPVEVWRDGEPVAPSGGLDRRVLSLLAATPGTPVPSATLSDAVYGAEAVDHPSPKHVIYRLRRLLGRDVIVSAHGAYLLDPEHCSVDLLEFEAWSASGRDAVVRNAREEAVAWFERAMQLWRGDALADWRGHPAVAAVVSRLDELRIGTQEELGAALAAMGRLAEATEMLEAVVAQHPMREHAWAQLMQSFAAGGRPEKARHVFDRVRQKLAEAGLEPGAELQAEAARIGGAQRRPSASSRPSEPDPLVRLWSQSSPFAGRNRELEDLVCTIDKAAGGDGMRIVVITGEPGVGKTRLAAEAALAAQERGVSAWFQLPTPYAALPYGHFVGLAQVLVAGVDPLDRQHLVDGPLSRILTNEDPTSLIAEGDLATRRFQLFEALTDLIDDVTRGCGGLIVLDDFHAALPDAWRLLQHLVTSRPHARACVVLTVRKPELTPEIATVLAQLERLPSCVPVHLTGLSASDIEELLRACPWHDDDESWPGLAERVHELTGGSPLYALSLARDPSRIPGLEGASSAVSPALHGALTMHLDLLSAACRHIMAVASVSGREFSQRVLATVASEAAGLDPAAVPAAIDEAVAAGVIHRDGQNSDRLMFVHELLRDALYERVRDSQPDLHLSTGRAIDRLAQSDARAAPPGELAHHFSLAWPACSAAEAAQHLQAAGEEAERRLEFASADAFFTRALGLLAQDNSEADDTVRVELFLRAGQARLAVDDFDRAQWGMSSAADLARTRGWNEMLARAAVSYADTWRAREPDLYGSTLVREAAALEVEDSLLHADVVNVLHRVDPKAAQTTARSLIADASSSGDAVGAAAMLEHLWFNELGDAQHGIAAELVQLGEKSRRPEVLCLGELRLWIAGVVLGRRRFDDPVAGSLELLAQRSGDHDLMWHVSVWATTTALASGRLEDAARLAEHARQIPLPEGHNHRRSPARVAAAYHHQRGAYVMTREDSAGMATSAQAMPPAWSWGNIDGRYILARTLAITGEQARADEIIDEVLDETIAPAHRHMEWFANLSLLADAAAAAGHVRAIEAAIPLLSEYRGWHVVFGQSMYYGAVDHHLGLLARAAGNLDASVELFESAVQAHRDVGSDPMLAYSAWQQAMSMWRRGRGRDRREASSLFAEARTLADHIGIGVILSQEWPPSG